MKRLLHVTPAALLLAAGASALAEEGVRVTGSRLPYVLGGVAAIALGVILCVGMAASREDRTVVVTPTGLPIPMPLFPLAVGVIVGLVLFNTTPKDSYTLDGIRYRLGEESAAVLGPAKGAPVPERLAVPEEVEGLPVTGVGGFRGTGVREVVLPESVERVDSEAFRDCAALTAVDMPGVRQIGERAFSGCAALPSVSLWTKVGRIGREAFAGCGALAEVRFIGASVDVERPLTVEDGAFRGCGALAEIELPGNTKALGAEAFSGCGALTVQPMPASVEALGAGCFEGCAALGAVKLERADVPDRAFRGCAALVTAELSYGGDVGEAAFEGCAALRQASLPATRSISKRAFADCPALRVVGAGSDLDKLAGSAFEGSPEAVLYAGSREKAQGLAGKAGVPLSGERWFAFDLLPDGSLCLTGWHLGGYEGTFVVPGSWCGMPVSAASLNMQTGDANSFYEFEHGEIVVEEGVRRLEEACFQGWFRSLARIHLPDSLEYIADYAITSAKKERMVVVTSNPVAIGYAQARRWIVEAPGD